MRSTYAILLLVNMAGVACTKDTRGDTGGSAIGTSGASSSAPTSSADPTTALRAVDDSVARLLARVDSSTTDLRIKVEERERNLEQLREANPSALSKLSSVVDQFIQMKATLKAKDDTIAQLRSRIKSLVAENTRLRAQITKLTGNVASRDSLLKRSDSVMAVTDQRLRTTESTRDSIRTVLTTGRILIGERGELDRLGVVGKTNRFGLGRVVLEKIDPSMTRTIDIMTEVAFDVPAPPSKVSVLTQHSDGSYVVAPNGNGSTVRILNPDAFWASSKVAVIMFSK